MTDQTGDGLQLPDDLRRAVAFHGHLCPGLLIGWRAAVAAAAALEVTGSPDEELILIAENDSCSVDAFQALLSTTFGKGNLIFRDFGKQVFTLGDRRSGRSVRVALRSDAFQPGLSREAKIECLLTDDSNALFYVNPVQLRLPERAQIRQTLQCSRCHEGVMETRTVNDKERVLCLPCAGDLGLVAAGHVGPV